MFVWECNDLTAAQTGRSMGNKFNKNGLLPFFYPVNYLRCRGISGLFIAIDSHEFLMLHCLLNGEENGQQKNPDKNRDIRLKVVFLFLGFV